MKYVLLTLLGGMMMFGGQALANDNCRNVAIKFKNRTGTKAKVTSFKYYDYDKNKWRSESVGSLRINNGQTRTWTRNLQQVNRDRTKFKVTYKKQIGGMQWTSSIVTYSNAFTCVRNLTKTVQLN